ncbi:hypothetical protein IQ07DRAFT_605611 [Pyrenochaeta sp. DS3sAY3a]|nr:hypothetical protein IQ07DRAFT_605611 [Pyrenochaeta sp. DS3sAY3a]
MCKFMQGIYRPCKHTVVLTGPENTQLCVSARLFNSRQGFDAAPAPCHPLPDEQEFVSKHYFLTYCPECLAIKSQETEFRGPKAPLKRLAEPTWTEAQEAEAHSLEQEINASTQAIEQFTYYIGKLFHSLITRDVSFHMEDIPASILEVLESNPPELFFENLFPKVFQPVDELNGTLRVFRKRNVSVPLLNETFNLLRAEAGKLESVANTCGVFKKLVDGHDGSKEMDIIALRLADKIIWELSASHDDMLEGPEFAYLGNVDDVQAMEDVSDPMLGVEATTPAASGPKMVVSYGLPFREQNGPFKLKTFGDRNTGNLKLPWIPPMQAHESCRFAVAIREWK